MTSETNFARPEDLLERSLIELREVLRSDVLTACDVTGPASNRVPVPRTCDLTWVETLTRLLDLIREIEAMIGTPADLKWTPELAGPGWLTDLVAGRWGLT